MTHVRQTAYMGCRILALIQEWNRGAVGLVNFTIAMLYEALPGHSVDGIGMAMKGLIAHQFVERTAARRHFRLTAKGRDMKSAYVMDPRRIGRQINDKNPELRVQFWRLLRKRNVLTVNYAIDTLVDIGGATPHAYQYLIEYCEALQRAGYVIDNSREPDLPLRERTWYLTRDTGPAAPVIPRGLKVIVDWNDQSYCEW